MAKNQQAPNPLLGKWKVLRLYCNVHNQGWTLFKIYGHNSFTWEFTETETLKFPSGNITYSGTLKENRLNHTPVEMEYAYYPNEKHLYLDRNEFEDDRNSNTAINSRYRLEPINARDMWIYDITDMSKDTEDYRFKLKIRRLTDDK